ncbi:TPA: glycosyltransferase family 4 protein [Aeromonas hydrophila]|nr:glycosyltransferase family 4 protein [Aeromonas hydrophila]HAT2496527.1 glycosyltransferase family 4 protein [Aeromonas hydrophila]HAT2511884.1 glycosyltransferase family 4 protein [Aeromonas hydrophila]HAT2532376.1 glycosyltransferase family 4 protein [Aeromonas hydrophila]
MTAIAISANTCWYLYNFRKNTIITLVKHGYKVYVIAPSDKYSQSLESIGACIINIDIDQSGTNPFKDLISFVSFGRVFIENKIDVVLNFTPKNNIYSTLAAKICGVKVINNIAGLGILFINESLTSKIVRLLYKVSQQFADKVFFQNEDDRDLFLLNGMVKKEVTDRLPGSGADLARFTVTPSIDDGVTRFLLIARMLYDKGVGHYVEAARILRDKYGSEVEFNLLGFLDVNNPSAVTKEQMQEWVSEGIVNYLGISDSVETEIAKSDCVVLPSFYREGVPKSLLEAGAMGKPIVTTDNVGCRETVDNGVNGFLCEPRSTASLVSQLDRIITMGYQNRISMGLLSRQKIENEFDENIIIAKYLEAIKTVLLK